MVKYAKNIQTSKGQNINLRQRLTCKNDEFMWLNAYCAMKYMLDRPKILFLRVGEVIDYYEERFIQPKLMQTTKNINKSFFKSSRQ